MTVSGLIRTNAERQSFHNCESQTHRTRSAHLRRRLCPRLERCRTKSWCRRAKISAWRTARAWKQSRSEKSRVSMAWEGYRSRLCKCNDFNVYGLFGRDNKKCKMERHGARFVLPRVRSLDAVYVRRCRASGTWRAQSSVRMLELPTCSKGVGQQRSQAVVIPVS